MLNQEAVQELKTGFRIFVRNMASTVGAVILILLLLMVLFSIQLSPFDPYSVGAGPRLAAPDATHLLGTDDLGRDVFSRVVAGSRISLMVGLLAAAVSALIGVIVGSFSGYLGGLLDDLLMRITEIFQVIPRFFLAMLLVAFFGASIFNIIAAIALLSWPQIARVTRSEFLTLKNRTFVDGARLSGAGNMRLIYFEILPNALGPIIVNATLQVGQAMLLEAGLSYLGLGDFRQVSLGVMLYQAQGIMRIAWWTSMFPGLVIFLAVLGFNLVGDGLTDILNPRSRER